MFLPWQRKRKKIRDVLCCEVRCATAEHIYCMCQRSHQALELQNTTSQSPLQHQDEDIIYHTWLFYIIK